MILANIRIGLVMAVTLLTLQAVEAQTDNEIRFKEAKAKMIELTSEDQLRLFEEAKVKAIQNNQTMIVVLTATWCGYCPSLVAQLQLLLEKRKDLAARYLLHPVTVQTFEEQDGKKRYPDSPSGMKVAHKLFEPIAEGSNLTFDSIITGWPTIFMLDPSSETDLKIIKTGSLTLPRERWENGKYHSPNKLRYFLDHFSFVKHYRCHRLF